MSEEQVPTIEESRITYEDKPNLVTMISGGGLLAAILYYLSGLALSAFGTELRIVQFVIAGLVILLSIQLGTTSQCTITIDTKTGYIEAEDKQYTYTGYAHEPELFMVLEKKSGTPDGRQYRDYKLTLKVDEETSFDVPLEPREARQAIKNVEKAKNAVPVKKDINT